MLSKEKQYINPLEMYRDGGGQGIRIFAERIGRHPRELNPVAHPDIFADEVLRYLSKFPHVNQEIRQLFYHNLHKEDAKMFEARYLKTEKDGVEQYDFKDGLVTLAISIDFHKLFQERVLNISASNPESANPVLPKR